MSASMSYCAMAVAMAVAVVVVVVELGGEDEVEHSRREVGA